MVNWTLGNKLQWNFNRNRNIFIQEKALENVVCEMASILSRPQCVSKDVHLFRAYTDNSCIRTWDDKQTLQWHHNGRDSVSNHQPHDCLLNRLFRRRSKKISKLRVTGLCAGNSPGTGEFPAQMASYAENVSIWWRHHVMQVTTTKSNAKKKRNSNNKQLKEGKYTKIQYRMTKAIQLI